MLVAPVFRAAIAIGKCRRGATVSTFQGIVILALAARSACRKPHFDLDRIGSAAAVVHA